MVTSRNIVFPNLIFLTNLMLIVWNYGVSSNVLNDCVDDIRNDFDWNVKDNRQLIKKTIPNIAFMYKILPTLKKQEGQSFFKYIHAIMVAKENTYTPRNFCAFRSEVILKQIQEDEDIMSNYGEVLGITEELYTEYRYTRIRENEEKKCCDQLFSKRPDPNLQEMSFFPDLTDPTQVIKDTFWNLRYFDIVGYGEEDNRYLYFHYLSGQYIYSDKKNPPEYAAEYVMLPTEFCRTKHNYMQIPESFPRYYEILQASYPKRWKTHIMKSNEGSSSSKKTKR